MNSKEYAKITSDGQLQMFPNPYRVVVANPNDEMKAQLASMFNWLEVVYTNQPEYDPETQYITYHFVEQDGKAVQVWEVHQREEGGESE